MLIIFGKCVFEVIIGFWGKPAPGGADDRDCSQWTGTPIGCYKIHLFDVSEDGVGVGELLVGRIEFESEAEDGFADGARDGGGKWRAETGAVEGVVAGVEGETLDPCSQL
jgi:hypothetical protein